MQDSDYVKTLTAHGMPEHFAVKLLRMFLTHKTGQEWCFVAWDPTEESPEPRREFVLERALNPPSDAEG